MALCIQVPLRDVIMETAGSLSTKKGSGVLAMSFIRSRQLVRL